MAQLKDLLVNGDAKVLGTLYTEEIGNNLEIDGGLTVCGRTQNSGDDEGIVIKKCSNGFAGVTLGNPSGLHSTFYLNSSNDAVWRFKNSSGTAFDVKHPYKAGTIALTSDIPTIPTTLPNPQSLTIQSNGTTVATYNGSTAVTANIPASTVTLNGTSTTSASFYAPTTAGTSGYVLKSNGSGAPTWTSAALTDTKVTQAYQVGSAAGTYYPVLFSETSGITSTSSRGARTTKLCNTIYTDPYVGALYATKVYGAVWNDYAEYRNQTEEIEPGYCVASGDNGKVSLTTEKFQACDGIVSDTFGFGIGETDECKTPLAVAGRVLAYAENPEELHSGDTVCAGPNGKVVKMTREEIREWPDRIVGIVSEIPTYETWGTGGVLVDGRVWIKVK